MSMTNQNLPAADPRRNSARWLALVTLVGALAVGCSNGNPTTHHAHHHPQFDFDERAMINGVAIMAEAAARYVMD